MYASIIYKLKRFDKKRAVIRARTYRRARVCARIARKKGLNCDENAHRGRSWGKGIIETSGNVKPDRDGAGSEKG